MLLSQVTLRRCEKLKRQGYPLLLDHGSRIGRGYADLGYEEFVILGERQLLSLFSGKLSTLPEGHEQHFFSIPSADELVQQISRKGVVIHRAEFVEQRSWCMETDRIASEGDTLLDALLELALQLYV